MMCLFDVLDLARGIGMHMYVRDLGWEGRRGDINWGAG